MCHQVPRRKELSRQVNAEVLLRWKPYLKAAIDLTVIGGEPFALKEAIKFIQSVIEDSEFEPVQLTICTNGTLLDRHMDLLAKKRKLQLAVSLDTIGTEFEQIRIGADWKQIERNIFDFQATAKRLGYPWAVQAPCMLMKTNIPKLVDFAEWSIANNVQPGFYDFINAAGIEATHEKENVVAHPSLLEEVPDWERYFILAVDRLRHSQWRAAGDQLDDLYIRLRRGLYETVETRGTRSRAEATVTTSAVNSLDSPTFAIIDQNQNTSPPPRFKQAVKRVTPAPVWELLRTLKHGRNNPFVSIRK
jgi:hypothetical protein